MPSQPLGELCRINPRRENRILADSECSFVPMESVNEQFGRIIQMVTRRVADVQTGYSRFRERDILFAKITPCMENGKCAIATNLVNGIGFGSTEFHVLRPSQDVLPEWVFYFLRQEQVRKEAEHRMTGSAGQKRVPKAFLEELHMPCPSLPEQQHSIAILQ